MSLSSDVLGGKAFSPTAIPLARRNTLAFVAITLFAVPWQMRWGTIPDTSWLITVCERMLAGDRLYAEIYETNPPFTIWLYLPSVAAAKALGIAPELLVHSGTYLAVLCGLLLAGHIVRRAAFPEAASLFALAPAFYAMLVIYPGTAFTEREHIGAALFLPLLALMAWRVRTGAGVSPSLPLSILTGLSGSVLLLVKPHYAVMVLTPALFVCWRHRSIRPLFAVEHWVIGLACSAYLAAVFIMYPEFIRDVYPVLADTYMKIRTFLPLVVRFGLTWAVLMFLIWRLWPMNRVPELASVAVLASTAGMGPLFWQAKGWAYHAYPALLCAVFALLCLLALPAQARRGADWTRRLPLLMNPGGTIVLVGVAASFAAFWISQKPSPEIIAAIRQATDRPTVALVGSDMAYGHPLNRMVDGIWVSTHVSDWLGNFALYLSMRAQLDGNPAEAAHYQAIVERYVMAKRDEFLTRRPDIISVGKDEQFWTDVLVNRYGFGEVLSSYRLLAEDEEVKIYLRNDYVAEAAD